MPLYEYRCSKCRTTFELLRPISRSDEPAPCPSGHAGAARVVSLVAARSWAGSAAERSPTAGGCACGGNCSCGSH